MMNLEIKTVEDAIILEIEEVKGLSSVHANAKIDKDCKPGLIGIRSQVLVDIMGKLEEILSIVIPNNCYIFRAKDGITELSINQAAEKLIKIAKHAK
jgi:hypothetical protein